MIFHFIFFVFKNHSVLLVICVYEREISKMSDDFKLISEIKDAVNIFTENKEKGFDYGKIFALKYIFYKIKLDIKIY